MRYVLLLYANEAQQAAMTPEEQQALFDEHMAYSQALRAAGVNDGGDPLLPTSAATSVRMRDGKTLTTHGPFAETTEQLGGFYILNCASLDEALEWATKNPETKHGTVEVRPVLDFEAMQS